jgi:hypothetical protein
MIPFIVGRALNYSIGVDSGVRCKVRLDALQDSK